MDRRRVHGGRGSNTPEGDARAPTWMLTGNTPKVAELVGLDAAATDDGFADTDTAATCLMGQPERARGVGRSLARRT
jgi:hypothetical protein